ncbi:hypothetical protein HK102_005545 [Quaeritorhiza haematococci]|nr:hypothetical protein HK102_005545 [Quaeritorhiza haematococci]
MNHYMSQWRTLPRHLYDLVTEHPDAEIKKIHPCLQKWLMVMEMPGEPQKLVQDVARIILSSELAVLHGWYRGKGGSIGITYGGQRFKMYLDLLATASRKVLKSFKRRRRQPHPTQHPIVRLASACSKFI